MARLETRDERVALDGERERLAQPLGLAWIHEVAHELQVLVHGCRDERLRSGRAEEATDRVDRQRLALELHPAFDLQRLRQVPAAHVGR